MTHLPSLRELRSIRQSIVAYNYYISHVSWWLMFGAFVIVTLIIAVYCHHRNVHEIYAVYHPFHLRNYKDWAMPITGGVIGGIVAEVLMFMAIFLGQPTANTITTNTYGHEHREKPIKLIDTAIKYRKSTIPHAQGQLDELEKDYRNEPQHTDLEQRMEPKIKHDEQHKLNHYEQAVKDARKLRVHRANYF